MPQVLIISDGKPGHVNQSLAFASLKGLDPQLLEVRFRNRLCRFLSYVCDRIGIYPGFLLAEISPPEGPFAAVVAAGSETYFTARLLSCRLRIPAVAVMLPRGYRLAGFALILAQQHDNPPHRANLLPLPINLCHVRPRGIFVPNAAKAAVGIVLGGPNKAFGMEVPALQAQLESIFQQFPDADFFVATSRRTPAAVEALLAGFPFARRWLYSQDPANPIPDFLAHCAHVFISCDSTSMISEAVSFGHSAVEVLPLPRRRRHQGKFDILIDRLATLGCLHLFDGTVADCRKKIDLADLLKGVLS